MDLFSGTLEILDQYPRDRKCDQVDLQTQKIGKYFWLIGQKCDEGSKI